MIRTVQVFSGDLKWDRAAAKAEILKSVTHKEVLDLLDNELLAKDTTKRVSGVSSGVVVVDGGLSTSGGGVDDGGASLQRCCVVSSLATTLSKCSRKCNRHVATTACRIHILHIVCGIRSTTLNRDVHNFQDGTFIGYCCMLQRGRSILS